MTYEEIEKWLNDTYRNMSDGYQTSLEYGGKRDPNFEDQIDKLGAEIDYINRLKAENAKLQEWKRRQQICNETNTERIMQLEDEKEQIRKETAREVICAIFKYATVLVKNDGQAFNVIDTFLIEKIAHKYGVNGEARNCDTCLKNNNAEWNKENCPLRKAGECEGK